MSSLSWKYNPWIVSGKFGVLTNTFDIPFWIMNELLGYVVHSVYITLGLFRIYYRIFFSDNMDNIVPYIAKTWWTHLENPMSLCFLVINALIPGGNLNTEVYKLESNHWETKTTKKGIFLIKLSYHLYLVKCSFFFYSFYWFWIYDLSNLCSVLIFLIQL